MAIKNLKQLSFHINGEQESVLVSPRDRLLDVLRINLGLTGTKEGCGTGDCGSCTVLLDGKPVNSCMVAALQVHDRSVCTIEGIGKPGQMHPVQQALVKCGGIQCGFCTPGMVMSLKALFDENPEPNEEAVRVAISSNLCRCTGYTKIIEAARALGAGEVRADNTMNEDESIGSPMTRKDAEEKLTGRAIYAEDVQLPRMIYGVVLRSPHAHARILSIDTSKAEQVPGVKAIITGQDTPMDYYGYELHDYRVLALEKVRFIGEPVAAVAATTVDIANTAADLIEIEYEELPAVFDPIEALKNDAPRVHDDVSAYAIDWETERSGNLCYQLEVTDGDVEEGFAEADEIIEAEYETPEAHAGAIEPHSSTAMKDASGRTTVWTTTQKPFAFRGFLAKALKRPLNSLKVVPTQIGGGFGSKLFPCLEPYAVLLAEKADRPVQMTLTRQEVMVGTLLRHPSKVKLKTGVSKNGTLLAHRVHMLFNTGAYGLYGPNTSALASLMATGPYRIPNLSITGQVTYTNNVPCGSVRCPGGPQMAFAVEAHMDRIARTIGMDPLDFRLKNAWEDGDTSCSGQVLDSVSIKECLQKAADAIDWKRQRGSGEGRGIACNWWVSGTWGTQALIESNEDGTFRLITGTVDMGPGGLNSAVLQLAAAGLGVPLSSIQLVRGDTDNLPWDHGTGGSRMVFTIGRAAYQAAEDMQHQLLREAADHLEASAADLEVTGDRVIVKGDPASHVLLSTLCYARHKKRGGPMVGVSSLLDDPVPTTKKHPVGGFPAASFCAHAVDLAVDESTGEVDLKAYVAVHDVGKAINPTGCEGQIEGGVAMGLGMALMEEIREQNGRVMNPGFADYLLLTAEDMPATKSILVEHPASEGPFGVKGVGEPPCAPPTGAVANAVADALDINVSRLPLTPEEISARLGKGSQ